MKWEIKPCWITEWEVTIDTHVCELIPDMFTIVLYVDNRRHYWKYQCAAISLESEVIGPVARISLDDAKELAYNEVKTIVTDLYNAIK